VEWSDEEGNDGVTIEAPDGPVAFRVLEVDARLIAAAPELLAVCKRLASDLDMVLWKDGCGYTLCGSPAAIKNSLLDVIAKAEGRE
jgi:hypothetical protein